MSDNLRYAAHCKKYISKPIAIRSYTYTIPATFNCIFCRNINNDDPGIRVMITVPPSGHITLAVSRIRCASQSFSTPRTTNPVANTGTAPEIGSRTGYIVPWGIRVSMRESVEDHASTYVVRDCACGFSAGTRGSHGTMISTRDVLSDTGPDTCGPRGSHVLHNSPSITSTIATLPHPRGCIMVAGALYTFPSQAKSGDIFRSTLTNGSRESIIGPVTFMPTTLQDLNPSSAAPSRAPYIATHTTIDLHMNCLRWCCFRIVCCGSRCFLSVGGHVFPYVRLILSPGCKLCTL